VDVVGLFMIAIDWALGANGKGEDKAGFDQRFRTRSLQEHRGTDRTVIGMWIRV